MVSVKELMVLFNCSPYTKDSCVNVNRNQYELFQLMEHQIKELLIPEQVHGCESLVIGESFFEDSLERRRQLLQGVDALITNVPGYCVCVTTADCVPVLLYDKRQHVVAAVHAGGKWNSETYRNQCNGAHETGYFGTQGEDVVACIGPSILLESFEVGNEVYEAFEENAASICPPSLSKRRKRANII